MYACPQEDRKEGDPLCFPHQEGRGPDAIGQEGSRAAILVRNAPRGTAGQPERQDHHDRHDDDPQRGNPAYRRVLWIVLAINAVMFAVEIGAGLAAGAAGSRLRSASWAA